MHRWHATLVVCLATVTLALGAVGPALANPIEGVVVKVDDTELVIDLGRETGVSPNTTIRLYRRLVVEHPITKARIEDRFPIGAVRPEQVGALLTIVRRFDGLDRPPALGDFAVIEGPVRPERPTPAAPVRPADDSAPAPLAPDAATLDAIFAQSLGRSLPDRIALFEGFLEAFPDSALSEPVGRELVTLRSLLGQVRTLAEARDEPVAERDELTVRHQPPPTIIAGERVSIALAIIETEQVAQVRLLAARAGDADWQSTPMVADGDYYYRADLPPALLARPGRVRYLVEVVRTDGRVEPVIGTSRKPLRFRVDPVPPGDQPQGPSRLEAFARYVDYNTAGDATDRYTQFESTFTYGVNVMALRAIRVGVGLIDGEGGPTDAIDAGAPTDSISLNYAFAEGEIALGDWVGIAGRLYGGSHQSSADVAERAMTGVETRLRIGRFDETRVVTGLALLDVLGAQAFLDLYVEVFDRLPMRAGVVVTNLPVDADLGVQLEGQVGYRILDWLALNVQFGWNARTINHYGFTGGAGLSLDW